jgi:hypothetical protein
MRWRGSGCEPDDDNRAASLRRPHMIKPGSKDEKVSLLIAGEELTELKRITWLMSESLGLDTRIETYQGKRPIAFYSWDLECLLDVIDHALKDSKEYPDKTTSGYNALTQLFGRLLEEYHKTFGSLKIYGEATARRSDLP